jgi:VanZ family protein
LSSRNNAAAEAGLLALAGLLAVVVATLWPFRFTFRALTWVTYAQSFGVAPRTLLDFPRNILLFIPLGLGVGGVLRARGVTPLRTLALTIGLATAVTVGVESLQLFLPGRTPNLSDIAGNIGGAAAAFLLLRVRERGRADERRMRRPVLPAGMALLATTLVLAVALSWGLMRSMRPGGWTASALWVADGSVHDVVILDRAIDNGATERLLRGQVPDTLSASVVTVGDSTSGILTGAGERIDATGQFTVAFTVVPADRQHAGRSRLVALRGPGATDDLLLAQDQGRLTVAWRSPLTGGNSLAPELAFPNVFDAKEPTRIVLSVDGSTARVRTTTGIGNDDLFLAPDVVLTAIVRETNLWPVSVHHVAFWQSTLLFATIVFLPAGALLARVWRETARRRSYLLLAGFVLPAVYFEVFISGFRHGSPRPVSMAVSVALTAVGFGLVAFWRQTGALLDDPEIGRR